MHSFWKHTVKITRKFTKQRARELYSHRQNTNLEFFELTKYINVRNKSFFLSSIMEYLQLHDYSKSSLSFEKLNDSNLILLRYFKDKKGLFFGCLSDRYHIRPIH